MMITNILKSNQEQAVASWVDYLNQVRINDLIQKINTNNSNYFSAIREMNSTLDIIQKEIVDKNRGGQNGIHGFIAEAAEVGFGNAKSVFDGKEKVFSWVNDNGVQDITANGIEYQMKFCNAGGSFSLDAVLKHLDKYPNYLKEGNKYIIPKDHYNEILRYTKISEYDANRMPTSDDFSLSKWRKIKELTGKVPLENIEPSEHKYSEVQRDTYKDTINDEKADFKKENAERNKAAYEHSKPSFHEGLKATAISAGVEGLTAFTISIIKKQKTKKIKDFTSEDWNEIAKDTGVGFITGSIRGASIYTLTNFTATPAFAASALTTASIGIAKQVLKYKKGEIDKNQLLTNSESLCVESAVSAISSYLGQALIPIPIIGPIIGNTVGTTMIYIVKNYLNTKEQELYKNYFKEFAEFDKKAEKEYNEFSYLLNNNLNRYLDILSNCFDTDFQKSFNASIELCHYCGVEDKEILHNIKEIDDYFL